MLRRFGPLLRRNVATMAARRPVEPLLVVLGSTGTGKSDVSLIRISNKTHVCPFPSIDPSLTSPPNS